MSLPKKLFASAALSIAFAASMLPPPQPVQKLRPKVLHGPAKTSKPDDITILKRVMSPRQLRKYLKNRRVIMRAQADASNR